MLTIRRSEDRGTADFGWLNSRHTFSFGSYHDPKYMGFGNLRVINEDKVSPSGGFATHAHRDMEIITYVLSGGLAHKDSLGNGATIYPNDVQRMTAGTGIRHSEYNASDAQPVHFLQIWILPDQSNLEPSYEQKSFSDEAKNAGLLLVGSRDGRNGSVTIHQDVDLYAAIVSHGQAVNHQLKSGRTAWLQVARGAVSVNGMELHQGDGCAISDTGELSMEGTSATAEVLLFDMG